MKNWHFFWLLPFVLLLLIVFNYIAAALGWPTYGFEILQKFFVGTVIWFACLATILMAMRLIFPWLYELIDSDFNIKNGWNALGDKEKVFVGVFLVYAFLETLSRIVAGI
jgi:hypothetical protein